MKKNFAVIGLGLLGSSIVETLVENNQEVLVIDKNRERVEAFSEIATQAIIADTQNETALQQLGIGNFDNVFIAIGTDIEASIMTTLICKELGVKHLICKAENKRHAKVLKRLGADEIIQPERDMGRRIAIHALDPKILNDLKLSGNLSVIEFELNNDKFINKTLKELDFTNKYQVSLIAVSKPNQTANILPTQSTILQTADILTIIGSSEAVNKFEKIATD